METQISGDPIFWIYVIHFCNQISESQSAAIVF